MIKSSLYSFTFNFHQKIYFFAFQFFLLFLLMTGKSYYNIILNLLMSYFSFDFLLSLLQYLEIKIIVSICDGSMNICVYFININE